MKYKGTNLNQRCVVKLKGELYWLLVDEPRSQDQDSPNDFILVSWDVDETKRLQQKRSPQIARISLFDENLYHEDFGQITDIYQFHRSYGCLCFLQSKSKAEHLHTKVEAAGRKVTTKELKRHFGKNITLDLRDTKDCKIEILFNRGE